MNTDTATRANGGGRRLQLWRVLATAQLLAERTLTLQA